MRSRNPGSGSPTANRFAIGRSIRSLAGRLPRRRPDLRPRARTRAEANARQEPLGEARERGPQGTVAR